jgi:hypothetical protein
MAANDGYFKSFISPTQAYWSGAISLKEAEFASAFRSTSFGSAKEFSVYIKDPTPKPKQKLAAQATPSRKISTYALGTGQSVAGLGETIPILFGKRTTTSGGMVIAPNAVYQRMHSEGVYEWLRAAYVIGEGGVTLGLPALRGIRLGSKSIDANSISYWSFGATTGSTADNDPTTSTTAASSYLRA